MISQQGGGRSAKHAGLQKRPGGTVRVWISCTEVTVGNLIRAAAILIPVAIALKVTL